jgi:hypothetical protein
LPSLARRLQAGANIESVQSRLPAAVLRAPKLIQASMNRGQSRAWDKPKGGNQYRHEGAVQRKPIERCLMRPGAGTKALARDACVPQHGVSVHAGPLCAGSQPCCETSMAWSLNSGVSAEQALAAVKP